MLVTYFLFDVASFLITLFELLKKVSSDQCIKIMLKLEIIVRPKSEKYREFSQSIEFIKSDLEQLCNSVIISEDNRTFSIIANLNSVEQLTTVLYSNELSILSGAIRVLAEKTEVIIQGINYTKRGSDLKEIRLNYSKTKKEEVDY